MPKTSADELAVRRWYVEPAIGYLAALACMLALRWRLHDLIWGFWITSLSVCCAMLFAFLGFLYGWMRTEKSIQGPNSHSLLAFLMIACFILSIAFIGLYAMFDETAQALHKRYPLPIAGTSPEILIPHALMKYWPLVLTVIASHWRILLRQGAGVERVALLFGMAFATPVLLLVLTFVLVVAGWLLRKLGISGAETLLAGIVLAFAFAPLASALQRAMRWSRLAHEEYLRRHPSKQPPPTA